MAYEKHTWTTGEVITAGKLNNMEDGIASGTLIVGGFSLAEGGALVGTSDKTWQEIHDALSSGARVIVLIVDDAFAAADQLLVNHVYFMNEKYTALIGGVNGAAGTMVTTNSADGYPAVDGGDPI